MANFTGLAAARHEMLRRAGWDVEKRGLVRRAADPRPRRRRPARHHRPGAAVPRHRHRRDASRSRSTRRGGCASTRWPPRSTRPHDGPTIVCAQVGNVNSGAFDPIGAICDARPRGRRLGARRRRVRPVGRGQPGAAAAAGRRRAGRLLGHRRAQVAQRPVRLGARGLRAPRGPPGRDGRPRGVPDPRGGRRARPGRLQPGVLPAGPRLPGVRGAARAGPLRRRGAGRAAAARWPAGSPTGWAPPRA